MRAGKFYLLFILLTVIISGCKQDFDITSDYKEIPVVYGLLSQQETTHYVRIQKGFLVDGDARVAAGVADSVYYPDVLTVRLIPYLNGSPSGSTFNLTRVDGDNIGLPKQTGMFANSPNILYTSNGNLDGNRQYELEVVNNSNGMVFKTKVNSDNTKGVRLVKDFEILVPVKAARIALQNSSPARILWNDAQNGGIYDLTVRFHYKEFLVSDGTLYRDTFVDVPMFRSLMVDYSEGHTNEVQLTSDGFLTYLANHVTADVPVTREFNIKKGMQFKFAVGGNELARFINSQQAQGGLASNEALPVYTNIDNGVGLLSSRYYKQVDSVLLTPGAIDSLKFSSITRGLNFTN